MKWNKVKWSETNGNEVEAQWIETNLKWSKIGCHEMRNDHVDSVLMCFLMTEWLTGSFCAEENALVEIRGSRFNTRQKKKKTKKGEKARMISPDSGPPWFLPGCWTLLSNSSLSLRPQSTPLGSSLGVQWATCYHPITDLRPNPCMPHPLPL